MADISEQFRKEYLKKRRLYDKRISRLFGKVARDIAALVTDPQAKYVKSFDFAQQKKLNKKIDSIFLSFEDDYIELQQNAAAEFWELSNEKNDKIADKYLRTLTFLSDVKKLTYYNHNLEALNKFISAEKSFSESVWKVSAQLRREMEIQLGFGILNGDSSDTISRRIRHYLKNPQKLFRRVRNENGDLVLSKNAKEYHPGRGKYRSAYKNARRLTRTTINMAYLSADHERWKKQDYVLGIKISITARHFERMPNGDICDKVEGVYPKWFKFIGWHPQCLCTATPVLMSLDDYIRQYKGEKVKKNIVKNVPDSFKKWISDHTDQIKGWKSTPYFIRDNFVEGNISKGLKNAS